MNITCTTCRHFHMSHAKAKLVSSKNETPCLVHITCSFNKRQNGDLFKISCVHYLPSAKYLRYQNIIFTVMGSTLRVFVSHQTKPVNALVQSSCNCDSFVDIQNKCYLFSRTTFVSSRLLMWKCYYNNYTTPLSALLVTINWKTAFLIIFFLKLPED